MTKPTIEELLAQRADADRALAEAVAPAVHAAKKLFDSEPVAKLVADIEAIRAKLTPTGLLTDNLNNVVLIINSLKTITTAEHDGVQKVLNPPTEPAAPPPPPPPPTK